MSGDPLDEALFLDLLAQGHHALMRAYGTSMSPSIRSGAEVKLEPSPADVQLGDVVLVRLEGERWMLHRVVAFRADGRLLLKGDGLDQPDRPVPRDAVVGRVVWVSHGFPHRPTQYPGRWLSVALAIVSLWSWKVKRRVARA
ncbi:MAG: S24/S26 family peptidase [Myxococcota bacterium]